ncbi:hypothetical protein DL769_008350 [Monosporascus sp. CRB-8-3]|nr:hypothetical protein DL769_008350 [Monosporascus sp. CRB-8-3]
MANSGNQQATFWDFIQSFDPNQAGTAGRRGHTSGSAPPFPPGFPFDPSQFNAGSGNDGWGPWAGAFGRPWGYGSPHRPTTDAEEGRPNDSSSETMRDTPEPDGPLEEDTQPPTPAPGVFSHPPPPPPGAPHPPPPPPPPHAHHHNHRGHGHRPFGPGPHRRRGGCGQGRGGHRWHPDSPPPYAGPFDFRPLMHAFASHPFAQALRDYVDQTATGFSGENNGVQEDAFVPPVDIFNTEQAYVVHFALPGASKEDIGVHWQPEKSSLTVAGVVYRPGNEQLLQSLISGERKVGMFERSIELPPVGSDKKEEVDGFGITAKMDNGILVVTVPKVEKDSWTEIHKIDVE